MQVHAACLRYSILLTPLATLRRSAIRQRRLLSRQRALPAALEQSHHQCKVQVVCKVQCEAGSAAIVGKNRKQNKGKSLHTSQVAAMGKGKIATRTSNHTAYLQILGVGTDTGDSVPSVLLFLDEYRYIFNVGEGFQRFCTQHRVRMSRINSFFTTRSNTQGMGGLPGMMLTLLDIQQVEAQRGSAGGEVQTVQLVGPPGLASLTAAVRTYVPFRRGSRAFSVAEFGEAKPPAERTPELLPVADNEAITITPVILYPEASSANGGATSLAEGTAGASQSAEREGTGGQSAEGPTAAAEESDGQQPPPVKKMRLDSRGVDDVESLRDGQAVAGPENTPAACYLCKLKDVPGKFLIDKAVALGVPRGPLYARLKGGSSVQLEDGRTVMPVDVTDPDVAGPLALIIDVPSPAHLPALLAHPRLRPCLITEGAAASTAPESPALVVAHLSPASVAEMPEYRAWMAACGPSTQHVMVSHMAPGAGSPMLQSSARIHARLNVLAPSVFPLLPDTPDARPAADAGSAAVSDSHGSTTISAAENLLRYTMVPVASQGFDRRDVVEPFSSADVQAELRQDKADIIDAAAAFSAPSDPTEEGQSVPEPIRQAGRDTVEVVFLGTGAAMPGKYRNVTGIYLHMFDRGGMLLDCGESSFAQLVRRYGWEGARQVVSNLSCIWISHMHADHHAGLPRLLAMRREVLGPHAEPMLVIGPKMLRRPLLGYASTEPLLFRFLDSAHTMEGAEVPEEAAQYLQAAMQQLGLLHLQSVPVIHCTQACGIALTGLPAGASTEGEGTAPWKLVFSGDTRPCPALVTAAKDATVLIHEATFDDELIAQARAKNHCITSEAISIGHQAGAYRTILTHFSQRYPKLPTVQDSFSASTCVAFDLMSANLADLPALPRLLPALKLLFDEGAEEEAEAEADVAIAA